MFRATEPERKTRGINLIIGLLTNLNNHLYVASASKQRLRKPLTNTVPIVFTITFKQIAEKLFQCFLETLEQHWDNLFENNLADLRHVFAH